MNSNVKHYLEKKGYAVNDTAQNIISICKMWYENSIIEDFHKRTTVRNVPYELQRMNFAKRLCADEAKLIEVIDINPGESSEKDILGILSRSNFYKRFREQIESITALGSAACYVRLEGAEVSEDGTAVGGTIKLNFVRADGYIPLTIVDDIITEAAFYGASTEKSKKQTNLVIFTITDDGKYQAESASFDEHGNEINDAKQTVALGAVKPFAILKNAEVNNIPGMLGYGMPRLYNGIPLLKILDLCFNVLFGDLDLSDKMMLVNETLCTFDENGRIIKPNERARRVFVPMGEGKLPEEKELVYEYNPKIRIEEIEKTFELALSLVSMTFGYGMRRYSFQNGRVQTATEYSGERQDSLQELNMQRDGAKKYISEIIAAIRWFLSIGSNFIESTDEIVIEFDDSYIIDTEAELEHMRADALSFPHAPAFLEKYIERRFNLQEGEGKKYITDFANV